MSTSTNDSGEFEPFFTPIGWGSKNPLPEGHLADDGSDPTYGGQGLTLGRQVYACKVCGAGVLDIKVHVAWHQAAESGRDQP